MDLVERQHGFGALRDEPPPAPPVDRETFQRWAERQEGHYELVRGEIVMMVDVSRGHALIVTRLIIALSSSLDPDRYGIAATEFGVNTSAGRRYPDILVEPASTDLKGRTADTPLFIAEVLSPSNESVDLVEKAAEYTGLASLWTYAVFSQDEPKVWMWERREGGFPREARTDRRAGRAARHPGARGEPVPGRDLPRHRRAGRLSLQRFAPKIAPRARLCWFRRLRLERAHDRLTSF